jgi:hypothetical protein
LEWNNTGAGDGIVGRSRHDDGVRGISYGVGPSMHDISAGVQGVEAAPSTFGAGVVGRSQGSWGVVGEDYNPNGDAGVFGTALESGVWGRTNGEDFEGIFADTGPGAKDGAALYALAHGNSGAAFFQQDENRAGTATVAAMTSTANTGAPIYAGANAYGSVFTVDDDGDLTVTGSVRTGNPCSRGCDAVHRSIAYAATAPTPTLEDTGESQLHSGEANVRLDADFANAIDARTQYIVLLTSEGENQGLYVSSRTPSSFSVREMHGGRSDCAFAYRIVAHPLGASNARLPRIAMPAITPPRHPLLPE